MKLHTPLKLFALAAIFIAPMQASAYQEACVSLLVGAGYAAKMRVCSNGMCNPWSGSFPIGKTMCQSLNNVPNGNTFSVEMNAILGKTITCTPDNITQTSSPVNIVYNAWGTTLSPKCQMPGGSAASDEATGYQANPEGIKAIETMNKQ